MAEEPPKKGESFGLDVGQATLLLSRLESGDPGAAEALLPIVYEQLRSTAGRLFRSERPEHTLQPTALVHEAYVKLINDSGKDWESREHFCAVASIAMRQILTDHARAKRAQKRGGDRNRESLTKIGAADEDDTMDALALDDCLTSLAEVDPEGARIVELRFFGGLTHPQISRVMDLSVQAVERRWRRSRAFIKSHLGGESS